MHGRNVPQRFFMRQLFCRNIFCGRSNKLHEMSGRNVFRSGRVQLYDMSGRNVFCGRGNKLHDLPDRNTSYAGSSGCTLCATGYTMIENTGKCVLLSLPVTSCPANTQDCGSTGCCPTTYSCSYYAEKAAAGGLAMCYKRFEDTTTIY